MKQFGSHPAEAQRLVGGQILVEQLGEHRPAADLLVRLKVFGQNIPPELLRVVVQVPTRAPIFSL